MSVVHLLKVVSVLDYDDGERVDVHVEVTEGGDVVIKPADPSQIDAEVGLTFTVNEWREIADFVAARTKPAIPPVPLKRGDVVISHES